MNKVRADEEEHREQVVATEPQLQENSNPETESNQLISEQDIDNFLEEDEESTPTIDSKHVPHIGMQFNDYNEAHGFFNFYAYLVGFSVAITHTYRTISKKRNNEITRYTYKCNLHGKNEDNNKDLEEQFQTERQTNVLIRTDCKCVMVVKETVENGPWKISRLDLTHNHPLRPNEQKKFLRSHKHMTEEEKRLIRTLKECNIPTRSMIVILSFLRGGLPSLPYTKKDVSNVGASINSETRSKDMSQVLQYLKKKEAQDPGFYYKLMLDENNKVRNIFWTDGRSTELYGQYGDCVSFDTTYKTNKYDLPFAPFVGMTDHGNTSFWVCIPRR